MFFLQEVLHYQKYIFDHLLNILYIDYDIEIRIDNSEKIVEKEKNLFKFAER